MEKIEIKVTKTNISLTNGYILNQGEYQVDKCKFTFSEEYEDLVKKAVFVNGDTSIDMVILNDECDIPYEILQTANEFTLKVYGYQVQNDELVQRYSPTALKIFLREGSYVGSNEVITPSQFEQYEQALHDGLGEIDDKMQEIETEVDGKIQEVDDKLTEIDGKIDEVDTAITETNNLDLDVSDKVGKDVTITLTKKDASTKTVTLSDGTSLMFNWQGTSLGIKTDEDEEYTYVNLQGIQGIPGPQGDPFQVKKTYASVDLMIADYDNMEINDYVMISGDIETQDNATLWVKTETPAVTTKWVYLADFSGASGIQGPTGATPNLQIGTVVTGETSSASITGTAENPILNLTLQKGDKGNTGATGPTGNGISSITKTASVGKVDTYTIAYTNGTNTTFDVTNGEVSQAQLDETNERVERAEMVYNALPKVNGSGEVITLDNTAETPLKMELGGNTSQFSTTGANQIGLKQVASTTLNGLTYSVEGDILTINGTATAKADMQKMLFNLTQNTTKTLRFYLVSGTFTAGNIGIHLNEFEETGQVSFMQMTYDTADLKLTKTIDLTNVNYVWVYATSGSTFNNAKFRIMLSDNASDTYEPYTGSKPSPSPDYPQDIEVVSGDNTIKVEGKNLFDLDWFTFRTSSGITATKGDGYVLLNGTATATSYINYEIPTSLSNGTSNSWFIKSDSAGIMLKIRRAGQNDINITPTAGTQMKQNVGNDSSYVYSGYLQISNGTTLTNCKVYIDVRKGDVSLQDYVFEPYQSQEYSVNLGSLELCKIGDYKDKIKRSSGKNLLNNALFSSVDNVTIDSYTGEYVTATMVGAYRGTTQTYTLENGKTYTLSVGNISINNVTNTTARIELRFIKDNSIVTSLNQNITSGNSYSFTANDTLFDSITIGLANGNLSGTNTIKFEKIQLEQGTQATTYEPYGKVWCKYKEIGKTILNGSETITQTNNTSYSATILRFNISVSNKKINTGDSNVDNILCNDFTARKLNYDARTQESIAGHTYDQLLIVFIDSSRLGSANVEGFKTWLSTHNTEVYYLLATPTNEPITDTTLINQLDLLEKAYAYQNQTNISQVNANKAFVIDAETVRDLSNIFDI